MTEDNGVKGKTAKPRVNPWRMSYVSRVPPGWQSKGLASDFTDPWAIMNSLREGTFGTDTVEKPYIQEPWVAASADLLAMAVSSVRLRLWDRDPDDDDAEEVRDGEVYELLRHVNGLMNPMLLRIMDAIFITLYGESYWFLRGPDGEPIDPGMIPSEIWPVRGDKVVISKQDKGVPLVYQISTATSGKIDYPAHAVLPLMEIADPDDMVRGISRVDKAAGPIEQNFLARKYQNTLLGNSGDPGGWLQLDSWATSDEYARLNTELREKYNRVDTAGDWHLLEGGAKPIPNRIGPKDMQYGELLQSNMEQIAAVMGVAPGLLGMDTENFATFQGRMRVFIASRVIPYLDMMASILNSSFFPMFRDPRAAEIRCRYDIDTLNERYGDIKDQAEGVKAIMSTGIPLNEALRLGGIKVDPIEGGDIPFVPAGMVPLEFAEKKARVDTAKVLFDMGVPTQEALDYAEIAVTVPEEEEPPEPPPPNAPPPPGTEPPPPAPEEEELALAHERALVEEERRVRRKAGEAHWLRARRAQESMVSKGARDVRRVFFQMRSAQLERLATFAETGKLTGMDDIDTRGERDLSGVVKTEARARAILETLRLVETEREVYSCDGERVGTDVNMTWEADGLMARDIEVLAAFERVGFTQAQINKLIVANQKQWTTALSKAIQPIMLTAYSNGLMMTADSIGIGFINEPSPAMMKRLSTKAIRVSEGVRSYVARTTRAALLSTLKENATISGLQAAVKESLDKLNTSTRRSYKSHQARALTIARTETAGAFELAANDQLRAAEKEGVVNGRQWLSSGRGNVRASHQNLNGQTNPLDQPFHTILGNQLMFPLDSSLGAGPADIVNCVCTTLAVVDEARRDEILEERE